MKKLSAILASMVLFIAISYANPTTYIAQNQKTEKKDTKKEDKKEVKKVPTKKKADSKTTSKDQKTTK